MGFPVEQHTGKTDYETPDALFDYFDRLFCFNLDAAAHQRNRKLDVYFGPGGICQDALCVPWHTYGNRIWCNWPYGRNENQAWARKCYEESRNTNTIVLGLCFGRYETKWWAEWVEGKADTVYLLRPRVAFCGASSGAQVPSAAVLWTPWSTGKTRYVTVDWTSA